MSGGLLEVLIAAAVFVGSQFLLSSAPVRGRIVAAVGERPFLGIYSVVAIAAIIWLVGAYNSAPYHALWPETAGARIVLLVLMLAASVLVVCGLSPSNPTQVHPEDAAPTSGNPAAGIFAVTRHPVLWGIALWALGHLLVNGDAASVIFFAAFLVLTLGGMAHIDARRRAAGRARWPAIEAATSVVPFTALLAGRAAWRDARVSWIRFLIGVVLYAVLLMAHGPVIGVDILPS